jgi:hypothetical protein
LIGLLLPTPDSSQTQRDSAGTLIVFSMRSCRDDSTGRQCRKRSSGCDSRDLAQSKSKSPEPESPPYEINWLPFLGAISQSPGFGSGGQPVGRPIVHIGGVQTHPDKPLAGSVGNDAVRWSWLNTPSPWASRL